MDRKIPVYFDAIVASPIERISDSDPNLGRLKVGVFTKYGNRNGSYITEAVAEQLIQSAINTPTPVVGFFDPETQSWASHTGPALADAYGYVRDFEGWQPLQDTDGVTRDYAIFSVDLFTKYYEEATKIAGQNQSMELDINSIEGDWANISEKEYFVYTKAQIQGLCIIGSHEPCFSVSAFFSKEDDKYKSQYDKFSSLLSDLKARVEEAENGGEKTMDEVKTNEVVVETPETEETVVEFSQEEAATEETVAEETVEEIAVEEPAAEEPAEFEEQPAAEAEEVVEEEAAAEPSEFEVLQQRFDELQANYDKLQSEFDALNQRAAELETQHTADEAEVASLRNSLQSYEAQAQEVETSRKETLIQKYEKEIEDPEEIDALRGQLNDFSYEELEGKLAILFAHKKMADSDTKKVPLVEPQKSEFALLMEKYRK